MLPEIRNTLHDFSHHNALGINKKQFGELWKLGKLEERMIRKKGKKVLKLGIEPKTFALLARRSNQLSYSSSEKVIQILYIQYLPIP